MESLIMGAVCWCVGSRTGGDVGEGSTEARNGMI